MRMSRTVLAASLLLVPALLPGRQASAQSLDTGHIKPAVPAVRQGGGGRAAPPAIPGAQSRANEAAPADRSAADLPPTEALFDAINRGDILTAKDAISRGAELDGKNLLGLSPLELSIDLGRNDISFLLLSYRGEGGSGRAAPPRTQAAQVPARSGRRKQAVAALDADEPSLAPQSPGVAARAPATPARLAPALFAGNGGAPQPSAGFLGFDAKH